MTEHAARESHSDGRLLLIASTQIAVVIILNMLGQACAAQSGATSRAERPDGGRPHFDVATIKLAKSKSGYPVAKAMPDGMRGSNLTVVGLIGDAYRLNSFEIDHVSGLPKWATSNRYDVNAKALGSDADELSKLFASNWDAYQGRLNIMLRTLLADRFKLEVHKEAETLPIYELVVSKNGPKIKEGKSPDPMYPKGILRWAGRGKITAQGVSLGSLASQILTRQVDRPVVDKTGLAGTYDFTLQWRLEEGPSPMSGGPAAGEQVSPPSPDIDGPSIFAAFPEQLGLELKSTKAPVQILVVDHLETPSEN